MMLLYGLWSQGASYYATHVGTVVCCYGDRQGSWGVIGVYPRQERGYSPSIRTRFNLPRSSDHTSGSTLSHWDKDRRQKEHRPEWLCFSRWTVVHSYSWKKELVQTASSSCWFNASLLGLFSDRAACEQNKANRARRENGWERVLKWAKAWRNVPRQNKRDNGETPNNSLLDSFKGRMV